MLLIMVRERDKYRAQFHQICGLALMSPFGKFIIDLRFLTLKDLNLKLLFCIIFYLSLFICGNIIAGRGIEFLEEKDKN